jgi:two-component system NtrC family sensor kinase
MGRWGFLYSLVNKPDGPGQERSAPAAAVHRRILLCDDSPAIHDDIRKVLCPASEADAAVAQMEADLFGGTTPASGDEYEIDSAYQGIDAAALVQRAREDARPYAVAFVDVRMPPGWDGIETINQLWRIDPDLQVVICTAYSDHSWPEIIRRLAPTDGLLILRKPFDAVEIRQMAHTLTSKWMLRNEARRHLVELQTEMKRRTLELVRTTEELKRESAERERIETELRLAQKLEAVGLVASGIAHEISTPIQFVGDSVEFLRNAFGALRDVNGRFHRLLAGNPEENAQRAVKMADERLALAASERDIVEALDGMVEGTRRIGSVLGAMKEFMHPVNREKAPADLNHAVINTLTVARSEYKYVARVETDLTDNLPFVMCHIGDLNQVFLNLVVNAAHAVGETFARTHTLGLIRVATRREGDDVVIEISDSGPGIPIEARSRVFEPFFTTKAPGRGTGQGLAIARAIVVDRHGGSITFDTEMGRGTTFRVRLPLDPTTAPSK